MEPIVGAKQLANQIALGDPKALQHVMNNPLFKDEKAPDPRAEKEGDEAFKVIGEALNELASYKERYGHLDQKGGAADKIQAAQARDEQELRRWRRKIG